MINPYSDVDFTNCIYVPSFTHAHATAQVYLNQLFNRGYKFCPVSNYYPSAPVDPAQFTIPNDVIIAPNAEHHRFNFRGSNNGYIHLNSLGSTFRSGSPQGETPVGYGGGRWQTFIKEALKELKYPDAGGITINHPSWTRLYTTFTDEEIMEILDFDKRVLGIEIYNASSVHDFNSDYDLSTWDNILKTGRKCWGFSTPDWDVSLHPSTGEGIVVLLVDEFTEYTCLKAFRNGNFYCKERFTDLDFDEIYVNDHNIRATASNANQFKVIIDGESTTYQGNNINITVPQKTTYARIEASTNNNKIYTNPIIYKQKRQKLEDDLFLLF